MTYRISVVVLSILLAHSSLAQIQADLAVPQQGLNPESFYGKDSNQGVYVRDSATALEKFSLAQRMERLHEWNKSADVYQEILEKYADRVVPSQIDADHNIYQYTSVATAVQEKLARWPGEGLDVYRARYESTAAGLLQSAGREGLAALNKVLSLYFVTDSGKSAGLRLVDLYIESGEFPAAAWLGDRLLAWHPNLLVERPKLLYRVALAYHLAGDAAKAKERAAELKQKHADAKGTIRGQDVVLAKSLEQELLVAAPIAHSASGDSWPMFAGSPDRGRISDANGRPGARLYSIEFSKPNWRTRGINANALQEFLQRDEADRDAGSALGVMPVVDRSELYFQDGSRVYAVSLDTGQPLPGWVQTHGLDRAGQYAINTVGTPRGQQLTITLTDDSVLAVMGQSNRLAMVNGVVNAVERNTRLVCLDRATGKEKWTTTASQLPDEAVALRTLDLVGSPLVVGDNVYVMGRGGKGVQFEDCYVLCFNVSDGKYRWSCYIASANTANQMWGDMAAVSDNVSHLAYASGRLYALTNLGAIAAVDAYRGTIQWLNIYPRDLANDPNNGMIAFRGRFNRGGEMQLAPARPWTFNPVIVQDGRVFVLPSDGKHVLIYDAGSGTEVKRINTDDLAGADTLLGVVRNQLIAAGEKQAASERDARGMVVCLDWQKYDTTNPNAGNDATLWKSPPLMAIRGRGFVTHDSVFIPCEDRLVRFQLNGGKIEQRYPQWNPWENGEGRGNVLVTQNHVILSGDRRVEVYTDLTMARARLDQEVAAAGNNPDTRLKYAEIMFASGQSDIAAQKLDEAIELLGGANAMRPGASRDRAFSDALTFAQKLLKEAKDGVPPDMIDRFFDRAAAAAYSPAQQVQYRRSRAKLEDLRMHYAGEVTLFQEILSDPQMRGVAVADDESNGSTTAAVVAEQAIDGIIRKAGASSYATFDQAAADAFAKIGQGQQPEKFLAIAQSYPNAKIAPRAMMAAADAYEVAAKPQQAAHVLRQVLFKYPTGYDKADVLEGLARNYLALGRVEVAISRLAQADRLLGDAKIRHALRLPNGQVVQDVTFGQALDALRKYDGRGVVARLPDFRLPAPRQGQGADRKRPEPFLPQTDDSIIADVTALAAPLADYTRYDRVVVWSADKGMRVHAVGSASPMLTSNAISDAPAGVAWMGEDMLVWSDKEIALISGDDGKTAWKVEMKGLPTIEIVNASDNEQDSAVAQQQQRAPRPNADPIIVRQQMLQLERRRLGNVAARRIGNQVAVPPAQGPGGANDGAVERILEARPAGDRVLVSTSTGRVMSIDFGSGQIAWQTRFSDRAVDRVLATEDFTVIKFTDDLAVHIVVLDTFGGQPVSPRRNFPLTDGANLQNHAGVDTPSPLVNLALAPDGTLVYTLPDRLCGKDLYDPGAQLTFEVMVQAEGGAAFDGAIRPDQLVIADGRILALSSIHDGNGQSNGQFVRVHSLETGRPLQVASPPLNKEIDALLSTGAKDWDVSLRYAAPYLYTISPKKVTAYNLDRPAPPGMGNRNIDSNSFIRDAFVGQDYLVLLDGLRPTNNNAAAAPGQAMVNGKLTQPSFRLLAHSRTPMPSGESGVLDHMVTVTDRSGITQWQAVDGGFCYLTGGRELHLLRGARK